MACVEHLYGSAGELVRGCCPFDIHAAVQFCDRVVHTESALGGGTQQHNIVFVMSSVDVDWLSGGA
jgi:hypothetical protein